MSSRRVFHTFSSGVKALASSVSEDLSFDRGGCKFDLGIRWDSSSADSSLFQRCDTGLADVSSGRRRLQTWTLRWFEGLHCMLVRRLAESYSSISRSELRHGKPKKIPVSLP